MVSSAQLPPDSQWGPPTTNTWRRYPTHLPIKGKRWEDVVKLTGQKHAPSRYGPHPSINEGFIRDAELQTIRDALTEETKQNRKVFELPRPYPHVRAFWKKFEHIVGASGGEATQYVYVEYNLDGSFHGRPITETLLLGKGMRP